jgi:hypothetical protein
LRVFGAECCRHIGLTRTLFLEIQKRKKTTGERGNCARLRDLLLICFVIVMFNAIYFQCEIFQKKLETLKTTLIFFCFLYNLNKKCFLPQFKKTLHFLRQTKISSPFCCCWIIPRKCIRGAKASCNYLRRCFTNLCELLWKWTC